MFVLLENKFSPLADSQSQITARTSSDGTASGISKYALRKLRVPVSQSKNPKQSVFSLASGLDTGGKEGFQNSVPVHLSSQSKVKILWKITSAEV